MQPYSSPRRSTKKADLNVYAMYIDKSQIGITTANIGDKIAYSVYAINLGPDKAIGVTITIKGNIPLIGAGTPGTNLTPQEADVSS